MSYALQTLWHERARYLSGVIAVTFSAVLIALQCGLLLGLFKITSTPIDHMCGDKTSTIWVGSTAVQSVDLGKPIPESFLSRVAGRPGVEMPEVYIANFANFTKPIGGTELCFLLASNLDSDSAALADVLTPELRSALHEMDTIVVDDSDAVKRLRLDYPYGKPKINGKEVKLVGTVTGVRSIAAPWVFCSIPTARRLMGLLLPQDHVTYLIARCESPSRAREVACMLKTEYPDDMTAYTAVDFSYESRKYWLLRTKAGIAIGYAALLGLMVGAVITAQTLYAATAASAKEFAILLALGIPRWRIKRMVLVQSFWVAAIGVGVAYPICLGLQLAAKEIAAADVDLRWEVLAGTAAITTLMAISAGFWAQRSVRRIEPMDLLR
jgi:putative ABC transport system permease protein